MNRIFLLLLLTGTLIIHSMSQVTITFTPAKDNTLFEDATGSLSNGEGAYLFAGKTNQQSNSLRRALLQFSIADSIPAGATITDVVLTMIMSKSTTGSTTISLKRMTADWGEGASDALDDEGKGIAAQPGDATWTKPFFDSTLSWTTPGGDFDPASSASTSVAGTDTYTWTGPQMVSDVQEWLDSAATNFGWIMIGDESGPSSKRFNSKDNSDGDSWPRLQVTYTEATAIQPDWLNPLHIFPNPANEVIRIELPGQGPASVQVIDMQGRKIMETDLRQISGTISTVDLVPGIYWIRLLQNAKVYGAKFERR